MAICVVLTSQVSPSEGGRNPGGQISGLLTLGITGRDERAATADGDHQTLIPQDTYRHAHRTASYPVLLLEVTLARQGRTRLQFARRDHLAEDVRKLGVQRCRVHVVHVPHEVNGIYPGRIA